VSLPVTVRTRNSSNVVIPLNLTGYEFQSQIRTTTGVVVDDNTITGIGTTTLVNGAVHNGNFMEYIEDPEGDVGYLYTMMNTTTLMCRAMINF